MNTSYTNKTILLILTFGLLACESGHKEAKFFELQYKGKNLSLPIDESTSNLSDGLTYFAQGNLLFSLNWIENGFQIYDLDEKRKIADVTFDYEGPNGVLDVMGIFVQSLDSIFLFNQLESQVTLIDSSGKIKSKIKYQTPEKYSPAFVHNAYFNSPPLLQGNKLTVKTHYYGPLQNMTQEELLKKELVYEIDLETGITSFLDFKFPIDYMLGGLKLFEASIAHGASKHVYSLFGDHRLFYVSEFGDSLKWKDGKSNFVPQTLPLFPLQGDGLDFRKYSYYSPHYESLVYDPYREVFIRFVFHSFEQDESVPVSDMRNHSGPFSIQIFDIELNLKSETAFEANHYHPFDYFITKEGIYLSINHPLNPQNKEDQMTFELLEFIPIKE
ncbi:DUF4221 family protein [Algoriphagus sp.]|uniref:DUF4221 family protein n=1 Tax=Algoriphagus sp. TaxID=1872435 RepID=UPI0032993A59